MTRCSLGNFVVVPTFLTRRLHMCKAARDPSGKRWNYLSRRLSCNFALMTAFTPFLDLRSCICTNYCGSCLTYSLSLPCMCLNHDSGEVIKFVSMRTIFSVSKLNKGTKLDLKLLEQHVFILLWLYLIGVEYEFEAFDATSEEIRLMAFYLNSVFIDASLKTRLSTSDEIHIITKFLCLGCTENKVKT